MKFMTTTIATVALLFAGSAVIAQSNNDNAARAEHVSFVDLDLNSNAGKAALDQRIRSAAERVCSETGDRSLQATLKSRSCYRTAVADGLSQMKTVVASRASGIMLAANSLSISRK